MDSSPGECWKNNIELAKEAAPAGQPKVAQRILLMELTRQLDRIATILEQRS